MHESTAYLDNLRFALRAIYGEVLGFRFDYPLDIVPEAGPKHSLAYYLYSEALSWEAMRLDSMGIPRTRTRLTGAVYAPGYIAWYGLVNLGHYVLHGDQTSLDVFLNQINWLERHAVLRHDGAVVWPMDFDYLEGSARIKAPWVSAHDQGLAISALVRSWRLTRRPVVLELLAKSAKIFELDVDHHGIRVLSGRYVMYTEKPGVPPPVILDGFMTSLLGLYDLFMETGDSAVEQLFSEGIDGLKHMLPAWDYRKKWSWYGPHSYLCPPAYHCLNRLLLAVLARLSNEPRLAEYAERWDPDRLSVLGRAEIYVVFLLTKNACRFRHRTWRQSLKGAPRTEQALGSAQIDSDV
jgi:hypothetical protein